MVTWNVMINDATHGWECIGTVDAETEEQALSLGQDMADSDDAEVIDIEVEPYSMVLGRQVQIDRSGVGHCWCDADDIDLNADIRQEIECEIEDGKRDECDGWRASNGLIYRWC
jgi:hypothetical protein